MKWKKLLLISIQFHEASLQLIYAKHGIQFSTLVWSIFDRHGLSSSQSFKFDTMRSEAWSHHSHEKQKKMPLNEARESWSNEKSPAPLRGSRTSWTLVDFTSAPMLTTIVKVHSATTTSELQLYYMKKEGKICLLARAGAREIQHKVVSAGVNEKYITKLADRRACAREKWNKEFQAWECFFHFRNFPRLQIFQLQHRETSARQRCKRNWHGNVETSSMHQQQRRCARERRKHREEERNERRRRKKCSTSHTIVSRGSHQTCFANR